MSEAEKKVKEEQVGIASVWLKLDISRDVSDFANRLSFKFTVGFILFYCGFATLWIFFFDTELSHISCWVPQHFKSKFRTSYIKHNHVIRHHLLNVYNNLKLLNFVLSYDYLMYC